MNIFTMVPARGDTRLKRVRIRENQTVLSLFTHDVGKAELHYVEDDSIRDYVKCKDDDCLLCDAGVSKKDYVLLPVLTLPSGRVEVLMMPSENRPGAMFPMVTKALAGAQSNEDGLTTILVSKQDYSFAVELGKPKIPNANHLNAVKSFKVALEDGKVKLTDVLATPSDSQLRAVPSIALVLELKEPS